MLEDLVFRFLLEHGGSVKLLRGSDSRPKFPGIDVSRRDDRVLPRSRGLEAL